MSLLAISVIILLLILVPSLFYVATKFNKTEKELVKLLNACETVYDLNGIKSVSNYTHLKTNILGKDPLKLYPQEIQSKYRKKYGS